MSKRATSSILNMSPNLFFNSSTKRICNLFAVSWAKHGYL
jgi:hypothetical protein